MKKLGIIVVILAVLLGTVYFAMSSGKVDASKSYQFIEGATFTEKIEKKESFVLYEYGDNCPYCKEFDPIINGYLEENNYKIFKMVTDTNQDNFKAVDKVVGDKHQGTPAVYVFKDGKLLDYFVGLPTAKEFKDFSKKNEEYFGLLHQK